MLKRALGEKEEWRRERGDKVKIDERERYINKDKEERNEEGKKIE